MPGIFRFNGIGNERPQVNHQLRVQLIAPPNELLHVYGQPIDFSGGHQHMDTPRPHGYLRTPDQNWNSYPRLDTTSVAGGTTDHSN